MCSQYSDNILPEPPQELKRLSEKLATVIRNKIGLSGPIPFSEYMEMALYEPGLGYYSAGLQKFGEGGDFVTAPQLGNVFARCLAIQIEQLAANFDQSGLDHYEIIEAGAGSGMLAADLLIALQQDHPPARYRILERSAHLRQVQKETLERYVPQWMDKISWLDEPPVESWQGVFLANEVLDALTVDRFYISADGIGQMLVTEESEGFGWFKDSCPPDMQTKIEAVLSTLEQKPADGYRSELNTSLPAWLQAVTDSLQKGLALFIDYGYTRRDYYLPQRRDGTLICHYQHRAHNDPFMWPGLTDISASVDFTALAEAADICGLDVSGYTTQAMFLISCGLEQIIMEGEKISERERLKLNNQVRQLTLPGEMGDRFQVMALSRGLDEDLSEDLRGFSVRDLSYRL
jgi:SAM-dependent MidA family methyltransferase